MTGWTPTPEVMEASRVTSFVEFCGVSDLPDLHQWSIAATGDYWDAVVRHLELPFSQPYSAALDDSGGAAHARWFVDGRTNATSMCLDRWLQKDADAAALDWHGEDGVRIEWSRRDLDRHVRSVAWVLRDRGIMAGDRVGLMMPMVPEAIAGLLAVWSIGAVAVPLFSGFGADAAGVRLRDAGASALLTMDHTLRRGREIAIGETALRAAEAVDSVHTVVVASRFGGSPRVPERATVVPWPEPRDRPLETEAVGSAHPLLLAYTSGTTGLPKGAVHSHGGMPVKVAAEGAFQHDLSSNDTLLWFSDMGWIMGPYQLIAALANGASLCLVEGAPDQPDVGRLWRVVAESGVTVLGMSPTLVRALAPHGSAPVEAADLSSLRILGSTGEPWDASSWWWYFDVIGRTRCPVINMSGGTEVGGALLSPHPVQSIPPGSLVGPALGMAVDVYDADGASVRDQIGELVCTKPWPGMTESLYGADDRYLETYWSRWPGVWVQGDLASVDEGYWFLHGRSDDTIMIAGKRLGPIEPESVIAADPQVVESAAVGGPNSLKGEELVLFVVPTADMTRQGELRRRVTEQIEQQLGSSFRPAAVHIVRDLPRTRSGKVMRRLIRSVLHGETVDLPSALDNPDALDEIRAVVG